MKYLAKTLFGLEEVLAKELEDAGASEVEPLNRAVSFRGDLKMLYKANYCLRTALSILVPIAEFRIASARDLMKKSLLVEWARYMDAGQTFSVVPVVNSGLFSHTGYPALVLKDAVADWFRMNKGRRPSVDTSDPHVVLNLHISGEAVTISLDSSGVPLYRRGYRRGSGTAPLNEVLAAGIILLQVGTALCRCSTLCAVQVHSRWKPAFWPAEYLLVNTGNLSVSSDGMILTRNYSMR